MSFLNFKIFDNLFKLYIFLFFFIVLISNLLVINEEFYIGVLLCGFFVSIYLFLVNYINVYMNNIIIEEYNLYISSQKLVSQIVNIYKFFDNDIFLIEILYNIQYFEYKEILNKYLNFYEIYNIEYVFVRRYLIFVKNIVYFYYNFYLKNLLMFFYNLYLNNLMYLNKDGKLTDRLDYNNIFLLINKLMKK
jgi:hypothetical protein